MGEGKRGKRKRNRETRRKGENEKEGGGVKSITR